MKRFFIWMLAFTMPFIFTSCDQKNSPSQSDVGTEKIVQLGLPYTLYDGGSDGYSLRFFKSYMTTYETNPNYHYAFIDFGKVNNLSQINYISGDWKDNKIDISVGHGYIVQKHDHPSSYLRLYIKEYIDKGDVQGYRIVYQAGWNPIYD